VRMTTRARWTCPIVASVNAVVWASAFRLACGESTFCQMTNEPSNDRRLLRTGHMDVFFDFEDQHIEKKSSARVD